MSIISGIEGIKLKFEAVFYFYTITQAIISQLLKKLDLDCNNVKPRLDNENGWISMRNDF